MIFPSLGNALRDVRASTPHNLQTHLAGNKEKGGHERKPADAREIAEQVFAGGYRPPDENQKPPGK